LARVLDEEDLIEHWTLVGDELGLLTGRAGPSKLGLALWLVGWVARHLKVPASDMGLFDWKGRTAERIAYRSAVVPRIPSRP
jgi:hypothetical protein